MSIRDELTQWLGEQVAAAGAEGLVCGLSGGIDSAVVAALSALAMPERTLGVIMPCHSNPDDERDAEALAVRFRIPTMRVPLEQSYDSLVSEIDSAFGNSPSLMPHAVDDLKARLPAANVKPRLRMTTLYFVANRLNYLVAGTGNRSEIALGYYTKYGDGGVDILPIGRLLKREVTSLARELGVPSQIVEKPPSAGLWLGQTDEGELGFTYTDIERFLEEGPQAVGADARRRIQHMIDVSAHKRTMPPMPPPDKCSPWVKLDLAPGFNV